MGKPAAGALGRERTYICIDLKTFYASVECAARGLDPFTQNLVVADTSRGRTTICLAISPAMKKLIAMVVDAAKKADIPVTICGLAVGNAVNATQYLRLGLRSFSMSPQNLLAIKKALRDAETR